MRDLARRNLIAAALLTALLGLPTPPATAADPAWVAAMREVHARGVRAKAVERGVIAHLGDSITYSMAYFAPLQYARDAEMDAATRDALERLQGRIRTECYRWKGGDNGNYSGQTASWGSRNVERWIDELRPEIAVVMFGTNDIRRGSVADHERHLRALVGKCLERGVVVILSTIPPMHGHDEKVLEAVEAQRRIASEFRVPLVDLHAHVLRRRPDDWDGTREEFGEFSQWEVPTLISKDGVHPSNPRRWQRDYTEEGLRRNGFVLRTWLSLMACSEVIRTVLEGEEAGPVSRAILGPRPPAPGAARSGRSGRGVRGVQGVRSVDELYRAVEAARPGETIAVADGRYAMPRTLVLRASGLTLRGASGDRARVVLDFARSRHHEGVAVSHASDITIADLTIENVRQNGIKINSDLGVDRVTVRNVVSHNVWQRHVKGPKVPDESGRAAYADGCRIERCLFYNDRPKQRGDEPYEDSHSGFGFNYVGGIDVMCARGWVIRENVFRGIRGKTGEGRGAVFLWHDATECTVERNVILDCDSGICLGNSSARGERRHANRCVVRNNFLTRCPENGILADHTRDCRILHNTVHDPESRTGRLLRVVHANDGLVARGNLFSGPRIVVELVEGPVRVEGNLVRPVPDWFVDPAKGDLHLTARAVGAIDRAPALEGVDDDIDGQPRGDAPDLGADELDPGRS